MVLRAPARVEQSVARPRAGIQASVEHGIYRERSSLRLGIAQFAAFLRLSEKLVLRRTYSRSRNPVGRPATDVRDRAIACAGPV